MAWLLYRTYGAFRACASDGDCGYTREMIDDNKEKKRNNNNNKYNI